ncbi:MAG: cytochrome c3 family protein [Planctomycetaceae bacterium]
MRATGKSRSQRINIDYYRQKTWLTRSRGLLALVAAVAATGYGFYVFASGGASHLSTGPVAAAHASFENDCQQCHLDFTPISADALRFSSSHSLDRIEQACQTCHRVDHHFRSSLTLESSAIDQHCSGCHTDHQGRANNMVNIASEKCSQCHGDLTAACSSASAVQVRANVTAFTTEAHGDFASLAKDKADPGRIKFDHAQHMRPGQVDAGVKGQFTIGMLEASMRESYRKTVDGKPQTDDQAVTLSCSDCHQFAGVTGTPLAGDDKIGRHIAPIKFDQHCAACHSLNHLRADEESLPLPHAAPWKEIETLIAAKVVGGQQLGQIRMPRDVARKTPLVGEGQSGAKSGSVAQADAKEAKAILDAAVSAGRAEVHKRCLQCHEEQDLTDESIVNLRLDSTPPLIPERWLVRGIYDHAAHRKVDCKLCHAQAYPSASEPLASEPAVDAAASDAVVEADTESREAAANQAANDADVVMIAGIESCVGCHRNPETPVPSQLTQGDHRTLIGEQTTWASDACIECHRYHWERPAALASQSQIAATEAGTP